MTVAELYEAFATELEKEILFRELPVELRPPAVRSRGLPR